MHEDEAMSFFVYSYNLKLMFEVELERFIPKFAMALTNKK